MDVNVINSTIGMEVEIHFDRAGNPGTILDLFAPRDANCSEETSIVIAITRQPYIECRSTGSGCAGIVCIHFTATEARFCLLECWGFGAIWEGREQSGSAIGFWRCWQLVI